MNSRFSIFIFLSFFLIQGVAKYVSLCNIHIEGIQENLTGINSKSDLKSTAFKVSSASTDGHESEDEKDSDCRTHGSGCCLHTSFLVSRTTVQLLYQDSQLVFTERLDKFLPKPSLDTPFQPPRI